MRAIARCSLTAFSITAGMNVPAYSAPLGDPPSITVPVATSDFATAAAVERLKGRLWSAARQVCKGESWGDDGYMFVGACQSFAMGDALAQVDKLRGRHVTVLGGSFIVVAAR